MPYAHSVLWTQIHMIEIYEWHTIFTTYNKEHTPV
jgi:hypothetical protein